MVRTASGTTPATTDAIATMTKACALSVYGRFIPGARNTAATATMIASPTAAWENFVTPLRMTGFLYTFNRIRELMDGNSGRQFWRNLPCGRSIENKGLPDA